MILPENGEVRIDIEHKADFPEALISGKESSDCGG
jgi:hypothetical protein